MPSPKDQPANPANPVVADLDGQTLTTLFAVALLANQNIGRWLGNTNPLNPGAARLAGDSAMTQGAAIRRAAERLADEYLAESREAAP